MHPAQGGCVSLVYRQPAAAQWPIASHKPGPTDPERLLQPVALRPENWESANVLVLFDALG
ncbi:hypothetical protein FHR90_000103 [Endobacter medicaginis]|uniref:Uncharacterized protein n=1 Tax=Endobacter medicaginis TaxID=1181271 RepID=A0A839URB4_9PROT|nr:hypothetical protein [Endobacter medicaginis]